MKAIILSAGQGRRLLPLTQRIPKCLLPVDGRQTVLEHQLRTLSRAGVERATVLVGFAADEVERFLARHPVPGIQTTTRFNPFYATADNLITAWLASGEMSEDFVLLNGDTIFETGVARKLLADAEPGVRIAVDRKSAYDDDDMKVVIEGGRRVRAIGKKLGDAVPNAEAIGMSVYRGDGIGAFREALESAVRDPQSLKAWYPSVLHRLAQTFPVGASSIHGLWWTEIDRPEDLEDARASLAKRRPAAGALEAAHGPLG